MNDVLAGIVAGSPTRFGALAAVAPQDSQAAADEIRRAVGPPWVRRGAHASRPTAQRLALAEIAGYGYCASHSRWYWGLTVYLLTTVEGLPVVWCPANSKIGEREIAEELLAYTRELGALMPGMVVLADKGRAGKAIER